MGQIHWSEPALDDLKDIVSFVAKDSPTYAVKLANRIIEAPRRLATFPRLGSIMPELGQDIVRELRIRPYRIIYRVRDPDCYILAVVHTSRDLSGFTPPEEPIWEQSS
ncbi:MAG: type II toxin-antitoxin system RelE/ParE family toxin [Isosphaeraceae bacterium]